MKNTWGVELNTLSWASDGSLEYIGLINNWAPVTKDMTERVNHDITYLWSCLTSERSWTILKLLSFRQWDMFWLWTPPLCRHLRFEMYSLTQTIIPNHCFYVPTTAMLSKRNRPVLFITIEESTWFELLFLQYINHEYFFTLLGNDKSRFLPSYQKSRGISGEIFSK